MNIIRVTNPYRPRQNKYAYLNKIDPKIIDVLKYLKTPYLRLYPSRIDAVRNTKHTWGIIISTFLIWTCYYLMTLWLLESCQIYLTLSGTFIILIMGAIIIAVPALPGGLGTYEAGITFSLMLLYSVTKDEALTYAIVSHASNYIPYLIVGSIYFIISGLKISDIKNKANS